VTEPVVPLITLVGAPGAACQGDDCGEGPPDPGGVGDAGDRGATSAASSSAATPSDRP